MSKTAEPAEGGLENEKFDTVPGARPREVDFAALAAVFEEAWRRLREMVQEVVRAAVEALRPLIELPSPVRPGRPARMRRRRNRDDHTASRRPRNPDVRAVQRGRAGAAR